MHKATLQLQKWSKNLGAQGPFPCTCQASFSHCQFTAR